jgi:1-acyl-sn-glycerol-3-phosphate acyltransferase
MDVWYDVAKSIVRTYLALFTEAIHVEGRDNLPPGPKIIVANHPHVTDGFILPFIIQEKIHFLIQADVFKLPFVGRLLALADQIPVTIGRGQEALEAARQKLINGNAVAIFPEGRLSGSSREVRRAGAGAALLAVETGVPLVPVGFYVPPEFVREFRTRAFRKDNHGWWQFGGQCIVRIGEPWEPILTSTTGTVTGYRYLRELTDKIMASIQDLVNQATTSLQGFSTTE